MKKLLKILPVVMVMCVVVTSVYGVNYGNLDAALGNVTADNNITKTAQNIWATVATIVQILSIAAVVFAGLRYMFASADQKADIKKSMGVLAIGAVLVFGATTLLKLIGDTTSGIIVK